MTTMVMNSVEHFLRTFLTGWAMATGKLKTHFIDVRTRQALSYLSDRDLRDIGLTREQLNKGQF